MDALAIAHTRYAPLVNSREEGAHRRSKRKMLSKARTTATVSIVEDGDYTQTPLHVELARQCEW